MRAVAILTIIVLLGLTGNVNAQKNKSTGGSGYTTGFGLRFGWEGGLTAKHFIKSDAALEGIISLGWGRNGFRVTGLYEMHRPLPNVENFYWFVGGGAHIGMYRGSYWGYKRKDRIYYHDRSYPIIGVDLIGGIEYKFETVPFALSLDLKPYFDLVGWGGNYWDGALSARYTF